MKVLIVEDEPAASKNLIALLEELDPGIQILAVIDSVAGLIKWIEENPRPELAFFDIQLSDEKIFRAFKKVKVDFPVIFTTAYDQYAMQAFKVNSIDYLLKPINNKAVKNALDKYRDMLDFGKKINEEKIISLLENLHKTQQKEFRKTFLVHYQDRLIPVPTNDISYFFIENEIVYLKTFQNKKYVVNQNMDTIKKQLDPEQFFRANRQHILSRESIREITPYFNERLMVKLIPPSKNQVLISKQKSAAFKAWLAI